MEEGADEEHDDGRGRFPIADLDDGDVQVPGTKIIAQKRFKLGHD